MIGYQMGAALAGGELNWLLAGIGAGVIVVAIPVSQKANQQAKEAVDIYNQKYRTTSFLEDTDIDFVVTGNRVGFRLRF